MNESRTSSERHGGSSHHFDPVYPNGETKPRDRSNPSLNKALRTSISNSTSTEKKSNWYLARDLAIQSLSTQSARLSSKQSDFSPPLSPRRSIPEPSLPTKSISYAKSFDDRGIPHMPTEQQAAQVAIAHRLLCSHCDGPCIETYLRCRVCIRTFHSRCLFRCGHAGDASFSLPRFGKQDWSCPECRELTRLITDDELSHLMHAFEQIDSNGDGYIILNEFLSLKSSKAMPDELNPFVQPNPEAGRLHFRLMDTAQQGAVAWSDFALLYSCKLIVAKNKVELAGKLTEKELVVARTLFVKDQRRGLGRESHGFIRRIYFHRVCDDLLMVLKDKYGNDFIELVLGYEYRTERMSEQPATMAWEEFLCEIALLLLFNRINKNKINNETQRASKPPHLAHAAVATGSRRHPEYGGSEQLSTRSITPPIRFLPALWKAKPFIKHARILEKISERDQREEWRRTHLGLPAGVHIIETIDEQDEINLPKLKPTARDDRNATVNPWTSVKYMQQLRDECLPVRPRFHT